jgi:hypothetical protein
VRGRVSEGWDSDDQTFEQQLWSPEGPETVWSGTSANFPPWIWLRRRAGKGRFRFTPDLRWLCDRAGCVRPDGESSFPHRPRGEAGDVLASGSVAEAARDAALAFEPLDEVALRDAGADAPLPIEPRRGPSRSMTPSRRGSTVDVCELIELAGMPGRLPPGCRRSRRPPGVQRRPDLLARRIHLTDWGTHAPIPRAMSPCGWMVGRG